MLSVIDLVVVSASGTCGGGDGGLQVEKTAGRKFEMAWRPGDVHSSGLATSEYQHCSSPGGSADPRRAVHGAQMHSQRCESLSLVPITPAGPAKKQLHAHRGADAPHCPGHEQVAVARRHCVTTLPIPPCIVVKMTATCAQPSTSIACVFSPLRCM